MMMALSYADATGYKPHQLKQILLENQPNKRNCKFTQANFQEIYEFWLDNCVNSDESVYNLKRITKRYFLSNFQTLQTPISLKKGSVERWFEADFYWTKDGIS